MIPHFPVPPFQIPGFCMHTSGLYLVLSLLQKHACSRHYLGPSHWVRNNGFSVSSPGLFFSLSGRSLKHLSGLNPTNLLFPRDKIMRDEMEVSCHNQPGTLDPDQTGFSPIRITSHTKITLVPPAVMSCNSDIRYFSLNPGMEENNPPVPKVRSRSVFGSMNLVLSVPGLHLPSGCPSK